MPQGLWRGALGHAYEQVARWREDPTQDPTELLHRRRRRNHNRENGCTLVEGARREGEHALYLPDVGTVNSTPLSTTIVERTSGELAKSLGWYLRNDQRTFEVHVRIHGETHATDEGVSPAGAEPARETWSP